MSSPQKPLGQSKPAFIWSLHGPKQRKYLATYGYMIKMAAMLYILKHFKNLLRNQKAIGPGAYYAALGTWVQKRLL